MVFSPGSLCARILYHENTFSWEANKAVCLLHLLKLYLGNVKFLNTFFFLPKIPWFHSAEECVSVFGNSCGKRALGAGVCRLERKATFNRGLEYIYI